MKETSDIEFFEDKNVREGPTVEERKELDF